MIGSRAWPCGCKHIRRKTLPNTACTFEAECPACGAEFIIKIRRVRPEVSAKLGKDDALKVVWQQVSPPKRSVHDQVATAARRRRAKR